VDLKKVKIRRRNPDHGRPCGAVCPTLFRGWQLLTDSRSAQTNQYY